MIYLDNNATTKMDSEVLAAMLPYFDIDYGNPSSILNCFGNKANHAIRVTKKILMSHFNAYNSEDFIFTSGATESNNTVLQGIVRSYSTERLHIITSCIEHESIKKTCKMLTSHNVDFTYVPIDHDGRVDPTEVEKAITDNTVLISIMGANNEIGTIQPIEEIAAIAQHHNILFHTDVTQYIGTQKIDLKKTKIDMMSFSAHKIHGPKGVGVLYANYVARRKLNPILFGGGQQNGLRAGTLNVPGIVGLGKAIKILEKSGYEDAIRIEGLRNKLYDLLKKDNDISINGSLKYRIPNNLSVSFKDVSALYLISKLPEIAFSTRSACSSSDGDYSYVLKAIGLTEKEISNTIRIGLSKYTTEEEILYTAKQITKAVSQASY